MQVGNVVWNIILDFIANNTADKPQVDAPVPSEACKVPEQSQDARKEDAVGWAWSADKVDPLRPGEGGGG